MPAELVSLLMFSDTPGPDPVPTPFGLAPSPEPWPAPYGDEPSINLWRPASGWIASSPGPVSTPCTTGDGTPSDLASLARLLRLGSDAAWGPPMEAPDWGGLPPQAAGLHRLPAAAPPPLLSLGAESFGGGPV